MPRRLVIGTYVAADTDKHAIALTYATGQAGGATAGYLKARSGNAAAVYISEFATSNDNEPRLKLAAGETLPVQLEHEQLALLYAKGSANDVLEFVSDATE